ncbi:hypothetical protein, partial [Hydrogenimonas sp.]|uniref:hypothetical protein n=1 Tax=Hydrogenimonas sp. TaxID=2231112 RepID=UPI002632C3D0
MKIETKKVGMRMGKFIKFLLFPAIFFGLFTPLFFHLGEFLDISEIPENSDLIVSLGGDRDYDHVANRPFNPLSAIQADILPSSMSIFEK